MHYVNTTEAMSRMLVSRDKTDEPNWWPRRYAVGCHFATPEEAKEYLDLCVELGESFTSDQRMLVYMFAQYPMFASLTTAGLLERAEIECSMEDDQKLFAPEVYLSGLVLDVMPSVDKLKVLTPQLEGAELELAKRNLAKRYLDRQEAITQRFENEYLRKSHLIAMGDAMIGLFWEYWKSMECQERWSQQKALLKRQQRNPLGILNYPKWRRTKEAAARVNEVMELYEKDTERDLAGLNKAVQNCYGGLQKICPLVVAAFGDCGENDDYTVKGSSGPMGVNLAWETTNPLLVKFGSMNLLRAAELRRYVTNEIQLRRLEDVLAGKHNALDLRGIQEYYPGLPIDLYPYCVCTGPLEEGGTCSVLMKQRKEEVLSGMSSCN